MRDASASTVAIGVRIQAALFNLLRRTSHFSRNRFADSAQYISEQSLLKRLRYGVLTASKRVSHNKGGSVEKQFSHNGKVKT